MYSNINSNYILEYIFSHLKIQLKLQIIIYNKILQKKLNIDINYYKRFSQKILKIDNNGYGIIYAIDLVGDKIFEGEFSNKKKNGKGIEYAFERKIYEGEYKNGKKNGYGKMYSILGTHHLFYEGNFKDGARNGYGKEYDINSNLEFEGEYLNNERWNGFVIHRHRNKKIYYLKEK